MKLERYNVTIVLSNPRDASVRRRKGGPQVTKFTSCRTQAAMDELLGLREPRGATERSERSDANVNGPNSRDSQALATAHRLLPDDGSAGHRAATHLRGHSQ